MAKERRDLKNRLLQKGEYQKEDGRYMYRYTDVDGKPGFVYSWTLTKSDRTPKGKTPGPCLRDLEREIEEDIHDGIRTKVANTTTVDEYFELYLKLKTRIKPTTRANYRRNYDKHLRSRIGNRKLSSLRFSDIKKIYQEILEEQGLTISTLANIDATLTPILTLAERDKVIRSNPAKGALTEVKRLNDEGGRKKKKALTVAQQESFVDFVNSTEKYKEWRLMITLLLGTGMRIGEACALTWDDCDFTRDMIKVRRTLSYYPNEYTRKCEYHILTPKTSSGVRSIPMLADVKQALLQELERQTKEGFCRVELDGVSGFIFFCSNGHLRNSKHANATLYKLVDLYNQKEVEEASERGSTPELMPKFSAHILRHTFCTRLCENGVNMKVIQDVMGHSKITMTMDVYTTITEDHLTDAFGKIDGALKIS